VIPEDVEESKVDSGEKTKKKRKSLLDAMFY
jgi:hypothetical protein